MNRPPKTKLSQWSRLRRHWEKKPCAFRGGLSPFLTQIGQQDIFDLLVRYSDLCRARGSASGLKLYVDGQPQFENEILESLPTKKDKSLQGYHARVSQRFADYCLVCDELLQVSHEKWGVLKSFMEELGEHVGIPNRFAEIGLYLGNYQKTPFGVHVDGCGVLSVPVIGTKTFRLWDDTYILKHPDLKESFHYAAHKRRSTQLVVSPGDIAYWPSSSWHIAESDGSFNATWSIGLWMDTPLVDVIATAIKPILAEKLGALSDSRSLPLQTLCTLDGRVQALPKPLAHSLAILRHLSRAEWHDAFLKSWLERTSKAGLKNAPVPHSRETLRRKDKIRGKPGQPILWAKFANGVDCLAVNGTLIELPQSSSVLRTVRAINRGKTCEVAGEINILQKLYQQGAIEKQE